MGSEFKVVTVLTQENDQYFKLLASTKKFGWPFYAYFVEPKLELGTVGAYHDIIGRKHLLIRDALIKAGSPTRFMFVDAWDTQFVADPGIRVLKAKGLNFSGQKDCWPEARYAVNFPPNDPFPYLNSGVIWGLAGEYFDRVNSMPAVLDQLSWTRSYVNNPEGMQIDSRAETALTLFGVDHADISRFSDGIRYNPTGTWPLVVHAAGKSAMPPWLGV